jgi:acyl-CoA dehydrogenase
MTCADPVDEVCRAAAEHACQSDQDARFPCDALDAMRKTGLLGLMVPVEFGGGGGTLTDLADATIRLARVDMSVAMIFTMHCQQVVALARYGSRRLLEQVLPAITAGQVYLASVTTEAGKGGHLLTSASPAELTDDGALWIDREAPMVTGGMHADGFLITMQTPGATSPARVDLVYASRDQLRLDRRGDWQPLGMRATESVPMRLTGSVPDWQVIGQPGEFRSIATQTFAPVAHIGWAAAWLGAAAGAYSRLVRYARSEAGRRQLDPSSHLVLLRLAAPRARLEVVNALLRHSISVAGGQEDLSSAPVQLLLNTLKVRAAEECFAAVNELVLLSGLRHGYLTQSPLWLERTLRDLRSASLNYSNDRLLLACGSLALMDSEVRLA